MHKDALLIGWREWAKLPDLNVPLIKVKIDTGAKTSALHAYDIQRIKENGKELVEFVVHPVQKNNLICCKSRAEIIDIRIIKSSNGHKEERIVIQSPIQIGSHYENIEITLTNRDIMYHRMLLGREAMKGLIINPIKSYCQGKFTSKEAVGVYKKFI
ncbi:MAG: RimK/LysX family protein [Rickettsiaceae bacterium]|nr:RimK/LysX family protein [Rickettsiaceae bacterium]